MNGTKNPQPSDLLDELPNNDEPTETVPGAPQEMTATSDAPPPAETPQQRARRIREALAEDPKVTTDRKRPRRDNATPGPPATLNDGVNDSTTDDARLSLGQTLNELVNDVAHHAHSTNALTLNREVNEAAPVDTADRQMLAHLANVDPSVVASLTPKQALFVKHILGGATQTEAARLAGYSIPNQAAYVNTRHDDVASIISGFRTSMFGSAKVAGGLALGEHLSRLDQLSRGAEAAGQWGAAIQAETNRGKASGLYVHKTDAERIADEANAGAAVLKLGELLGRVQKRGG